jgi:hypothetical protein
LPEQSHVAFGTKVVNKDGGHSQKPHNEVFVVLAAATGGKEVMGGAGQVENATNMDDKGRVNHIRALEGMGQLASQGFLNPDLAGEIAGDSQMTFKEAGGSKTAGEVGLVVKKPTEQYEVKGTVGHDGNVAEMNKEGRAYSDDEGVEEMGEKREKEQCLEDSISAEEEDPRYVIVPFIPTKLEHQDFYILREFMDVMKEGTGVYTLNQGGTLVVL